MSFLSKPVLPKEHGAWVALLVPMFIGAAAYPGESFNLPSLLLLAISSCFGMLFTEPVRIVLKQAIIVDRLKVYGWMMIYFVVSASSFILLIYLYDRWGLLWFVIPAILIATMKLWSSIVKMERIVWIEVVGTLGLTISAPAAFYTQNGSFPLESLILYLLCSIWVVERATAARTILSNMRSGGGGLNLDNASKTTFKGLSGHILGLLAVAIILAIFPDNAPWLAFLPFLLATYKNMNLMVLGKIPADPFKFGFSEMRLSAFFAILMVFAWRIDKLL